MEQKFFFFDIDNTLAVWPEGKIPDSAQYCIDELQRRGHLVSIATGRIQVDAMRFAEQARITNVVADGGHSITIDGNLVSMIGMNREMCIQYLEYLESKHIPWAVTDRNKLGRITPYKEILEWHPDWDVFKTVVDPEFDFHSVEDFYKPMEKALGIRDMIGHFDIKPNQVVVFGDGYNDLSMFRPEWLNIAMGNARPELKLEADYVTTDCDKDGIYNACKHFGWID